MKLKADLKPTNLVYHFDYAPHLDLVFTANHDKQFGILDKGTWTVGLGANPFVKGVIDGDYYVVVEIETAQGWIKVEGDRSARVTNLAELLDWCDLPYYINLDDE